MAQLVDETAVDAFGILWNLVHVPVDAPVAPASLVGVGLLLRAFVLREDVVEAYACLDAIGRRGVLRLAEILPPLVYMRLAPVLKGVTADQVLGL